MSKNFYDKVAKKFGGYGYSRNNPKYITEFSNGIPEDEFKKHLLKLSGKDKIALDVGCGDCRFAFGIAKYFKEIIAIDNSAGLINIAKSKQKESKNRNVKILKTDANKIKFREKLFDVAFSRRGPTPYKKIVKALKEKGYFLVIGIGEKDAIDIKKIFDRGQNYGNWKNSILKKGEKEANEAGFKTIFAKDYFYNQYYRTYNDLDLFLQGVPIFEDFDSEKDKKRLEKYVKKFKTNKGIRLFRHRIVFVFQKAKNNSN